MGTVNCRLDCIGKKVLSVTMPWAWLIMKWGKDIENRTWKTNYRGRILIHASKKPDPKMGEILFGWSARITDDCNRAAYMLCGCIIGSVELVDCVQGHGSRWAEPGMWHWVLRNPEIFNNPIQTKGSLGLWEYKG